MIAFINLFFIPMIVIYIYYARKKEKLVFSLRFAVKYCIVTVLTFILTKICAQLVNIFYPLALPPDRAPYTLIAIPVALVLPFLIEFIRKYVHIDIKVEENKNEE